jgi:endo-1,4-beta-xylanase
LLKKYLLPLVLIFGGRTITYDGTFNPTGNAYLSVYGFTLNPLVEYYVLESHGTYNPGDVLQYKGSFESDGSIYKVYLVIRTSNLNGEPVLRQYWSVRQNQRVSGSVNMQNHFDAWAGFGMGIGTHDFQIVSTEGYQSKGNSDIYVEIE